MLAKKFRLPISGFPLRAKIFYRGKYFTVKTIPNSFPYNRVGVILTKKTTAKAVERNRLRRKVFDLFRVPLRPAGSAGYVDLLVLIKPIKLDADAEEKLFRELNLIKEKLFK